MLLQPPPLLPRLTTKPLWICTSCRARARDATSPPLRTLRRRVVGLPQTASFHASSRRADKATPNHYATLELRQSATPAEIKRQFYTLSKKHHPDHNAADPNASTRFVAISEAYHVLSVPSKRAQYDAQLQQTQSRSPNAEAYPRGSYSSASFAGSRPATGLNKKRTTFRGPPPSFYKGGGYGRHSAKRAEYAYAQHPHAGEQHSHKSDHSAGTHSYRDPDGFGPGQSGQGTQVPHFDDRKHKETHHHVYEHINTRRKRARAAEIPDELDRGGILANFIMVSGVVGIVAFIAKIFGHEVGTMPKDAS